MSVGDISEGWLRECDSSAGGLSPGGGLQHHVLQEELSPGGWHCTSWPAYSARMNIGEELIMCDFLGCTLGQL